MEVGTGAVGAEMFSLYSSYLSEATKRQGESRVCRAQVMWESHCVGQSKGVQVTCSRWGRPFILRAEKSFASC